MALNLGLRLGVDLSLCRPFTQDTLILKVRALSSLDSQFVALHDLQSPRPPTPRP